MGVILRTVLMVLRKAVPWFCFSFIAVTLGGVINLPSSNDPTDELDNIKMKRFFPPYFNDRRQQGDICQAMYDMVKLGKRNVPLALHDKKCLGLLMASYQQLESAKTNCRNFDEDCQRKQNAIAGDILDKMADCYGISVDEIGRIMKSPPLVYRVI